MQVNGFKKSLFGFNKKEVLSYMETMSKDVEDKIRNKDDDIKELKNQLIEKNTAINNYAKDLESQKITFEAELEALKNEFENERAKLTSKYEALKEEFSIEKLKIGKAILAAEESATEILINAKETANEIIEEAKRKAETEKEKYRQSKADVSDFTYDIKKLLDKLTADIKDKTGKGE
jgi:cell division septum initiation protein DivIVA